MFNSSVLSKILPTEMFDNIYNNIIKIINITNPVIINIYCNRWSMSEQFKIEQQKYRRFRSANAQKYGYQMLFHLELILCINLNIFK